MDNNTVTKKYTIETLLSFLLFFCLLGTISLFWIYILELFNIFKQTLSWPTLLWIFVFATILFTIVALIYDIITKKKQLTGEYYKSNRVWLILSVISLCIYGLICLFSLIGNVGIAFGCYIFADSPNYVTQCPLLILSESEFSLFEIYLFIMGIIFCARKKYFWSLILSVIPFLLSVVYIIIHKIILYGL